MLKSRSDFGSVKIVDFGLTEVYEADIHCRVKDKIGTLIFMAPEQVTYTGYGKKVDVWAAGVIIYKLLTGKHPFMREEQSVKEFIDCLKNIGDLELPPDCGASFYMRDLFSKLCKANPTE